MVPVEYANYYEIPMTIKEMILTVSGEKSIEDVPLEDINDFLNGYFEFQASQNLDSELPSEEEYDEGGWVR